MLHYSGCVVIVLHGRKALWSQQHEEWLKEYKIPVFANEILEVEHEGCDLRALLFAKGERLAVDALFTTRGDIYYNKLAKSAGAEIDQSGEIVTDTELMTSVPGLYAAGCVTAANCQMIIAAGQGATAAQAINRSLFEESLRNHRLRRHREKQHREEKTEPDVLTPAQADA
jgi:thioredoxin reductase (NADPH)